MSRTEKIKKLAKNNGYSTTRNLVIEEMSELSKALMKYERIIHLEQNKDEAFLEYFFKKQDLLYEAKISIEEEISDVLITVYELIEFFNEGNIEKFTEYKIERALKNES